MEEASSGNGELLLTTLKALARRGVMLRRQDDGTGLIEHHDPRRQARRIEPQALSEMLEAGWIRTEGENRYVISRRGIATLRNLLNRPDAVRLQKGHETRCTAAKAPAGQNARTPPAIPAQNLRESPLAWLRQRRDKDGKPMISATELEAGERLRSDFERGQMGPRVTASWNPAAAAGREGRGAPGAGMELADVVVAARQRVEMALKAVGPELAGMLLDVCCFLHGLEQAERNGGWPRRAGKVVLQLGLAHLARHYGLDRRSTSAEGRTTSWHADGWETARQRKSAEAGEA